MGHSNAEKLHNANIIDMATLNDGLIDAINSHSLEEIEHTTAIAESLRSSLGSKDEMSFAPF